MLWQTSVNDNASGLVECSYDSSTDASRAAGNNDNLPFISVGRLLPSIRAGRRQSSQQYTATSLMRDYSLGMGHKAGALGSAYES